MKNKSLRWSSLASREMICYKTLFAYRNLWMFLSMVGIIIYHSPFDVAQGRVWDVIKTYSYIGVDVFVFCSGIGCGFSLYKDADILRFLKRRARRILPIYLVCLLFWGLYCRATSGFTLLELIGNLLGQGYMANLGNQMNWFFGCLWLCYFASPFFWALAQACQDVWRRMGITVCLVVFSFTFFRQMELLMWCRLPVFFLGICMAQRSSVRQGLSWAEGLGLLAQAAAGAVLLGWLNRNHPQLMWEYACWWYPLILVCPGLCCLLSLGAALLERTPLKGLVRLCARAGTYTLPLSLTHVIIFAAYRTLAERGWFDNGWVPYLCALGLTAVSSWLLQTLDDAWDKRRKTPAR